jgi:hypothetical protein
MKQFLFRLKDPKRREKMFEIFVDKKNRTIILNYESMLGTAISASNHQSQRKKCSFPIESSTKSYLGKILLLKCEKNDPFYFALKKKKHFGFFNRLYSFLPLFFLTMKTIFLRQIL